MTSVDKTPRPLLPAQVVQCWERLQTKPLAYRLARGAFWCLVGAAASRGLALVASIVTARLLGKTVFGELGVLQSTIGLFGTFAAFGLGVTATKYVAEFRSSDPQKAGRIIALSNFVAFVTGTLAATGLAVFSDAIAAGPLAAPHLSGLLRVSSLLLLLTAINGAQTGALAGFEVFKKIAVINTWTGFVAFPLMITGVLLGGLTGVIWAMVATTLVNCILNGIALRKVAAEHNVPLASNGWHHERRVLWTFALPATLSGLLVTPVYWVCNLILIAQPGGYAEIGLFSAANQWKLSILFVPTVLVQLVLPVLSSLHSQRDFTNQRKVIFSNVCLNAAVCLVPAVVIAFLGSTIMAFYGATFVAGTAALRFLAFSAVLSASIGVIGQFIASSDRMWWGFLLNAIWASSIIALTILLRKRGATGLAMADFFSYCVHLLTVTIFVFWQFRGVRTPDPRV